MSNCTSQRLGDTWRPGMAAEMRKHPRCTLEVAVTVSSEHNFFAGFARNISEGGIFIATFQVFPVGTRIAVTFTLPEDDRPIEVIGEVRWLKLPHDRMESSPGIGIRFVEIEPQDLLRVKAFIESVRDELFFEE